MSFDTFVGLPLDQSIASAAWDSADLSWSSATYLVGNGANAVKSTISGAFGIHANYTPLAGHVGQAVFFKPIAGRDTTGQLIGIILDASGTSDQYSPSAGVRASVGAYGALILRDMVTSTEVSIACALTDGNEYCLEVQKTTDVSGKQYRATVYNASNGARGTQVATQTITIATALANRRVCLSGQGTNAAYFTVSRVESVDGAAASPVTFSGPVPTRNGTVGSSASFAHAGFFAGSATPFTYSLQAGTLPAGLTLSSTTGIISGTPTTAGTQSGIVVRATDANAATADTNAYSIVIAASNAAPTFPGVIGNISGTAGTAITPVNVSGQFSDTDALTYSVSPAGTAWPSGLVVNASTGIISGTVAASTTTGLKVRATDTASQTVDSNAFSVTIGAAQTSTGTITWPYPIVPINGDARLAAGHRIVVCNMTTDALVVKKTGLVTHATTGVPPAISDALIVAGTQYRCHLILDSDNTASGTEVITAT